MAEKKHTRVILLSGFLLILICYFLYLQNYDRARPVPSIIRLGAPRFMEEKANEAVAAAQAQYDIKLDGSVQSVELVEQILSQLHEQHRKTPMEDRTLRKEALMWGAYVGEVIKTQTDSEWHHDRQTGALTLDLSLNNKSFPFMPHSWCSRRINEETPQNNVWMNFLCVVVDPYNPEHQELREILEPLKEAAKD